MSGFLAGLAGGLGGANRFIEMLMAQRERAAADEESRRRFEAQMGLQQKQFDWTRESRGEDVTFRDKEFADARQRWEQEQQRAADESSRRDDQFRMQHTEAQRRHGESQVLEAGRAAGVIPRDPRRAYALTAAGELPAETADLQFPGGSLPLRALRGAGQTAATQHEGDITRILADLTKRNAAQAHTQTALGPYTIQNPQYQAPTQRVPTPVDPHRQRADLNEAIEKVRARQQGIYAIAREEVLKSMPEIDRRYGAALASGDPNRIRQEEELINAQFGPTIQARAKELLDADTQAAFSRLSTLFADIITPEQLRPMLGMGAAAPESAMQEMFRRLGITLPTPTYPRR